MIGEAIDRLVSIVSPAQAARRTHARQVYRQAVNRSYDAARVNRLNSNWRTHNNSADLELLSDADVIRSRARDLVRNNAYAKGIQKALVRNVVGCGIKPQSRVGREETDTLIEELWERWQRKADVTGRLSFYEIQTLAYSEVLEAGEVLIRHVESPNRNRPIPYAIEMIEADRFATDYVIRGRNHKTGNEVRRGVELNDFGEPVGYWLYTSHPNGVNTWRQEAQFYPAEEFEHLFRMERVGQTRGVSVYASVLMWLKTLGYYVENELQSSAVASCFTAAIKTVGGPADGGLLDDIDTSNTDTDGNRFEYLQPGLVTRLFPGEEVQTINPSRSHNEAQAWIDLMIRSLAVGTGISYERLSRDYSKTNYSSNRASDLEDRREFRSTQDWIITHLCEPVWKRFLASGVEAGTPGLPSPVEFLAMYGDWTQHIWQAPGWEWVDPAKEQKASAESIATNLSTLSDELGKRGKDWRDVLQQRSREQQFIESLGLVVTQQTPAGEPVEEDADG